MITERDLQEAIAECQGQREPNANTCIKLAAFYTIRKELFGKQDAEYSYDPAPNDVAVEIDSDTDFARLVDGRPQKEIWPVLDELMETLRKMQPRLYYMVMDKLQ